MKSIQYNYDSVKSLIEIPGSIFGPNGDANLSLVFDPGSYRTIISGAIIENLGYSETGESSRVRTTSVAGIERGYTVVLERMVFLMFTFENIEVACFDIPAKYKIDGLLGLDFIENFEIILKHRKHQITFREL